MILLELIVATDGEKGIEMVKGLLDLLKVLIIRNMFKIAKN